MRKTAGTLSRLGGFLGRAWLGVITGIIWLSILGAGFATVINGSGETGGNILIGAGYTVASMVWGGLIVWSYRREPMRKMASEIREGQEKIREGQETIISSLPPPPADAPVLTLHPGGKAHT